MSLSTYDKLLLGFEMVKNHLDCWELDLVATNIGESLHLQKRCETMRDVIKYATKERKFSLFDVSYLITALAKTDICCVFLTLLCNRQKLIDLKYHDEKVREACESFYIRNNSQVIEAPVFKGNLSGMNLVGAYPDRLHGLTNIFRALDTSSCLYTERLVRLLFCEGAESWPTSSTRCPRFWSHIFSENKVRVFLRHLNIFIACGMPRKMANKLRNYLIASYCIYCPSAKVPKTITDAIKLVHTTKDRTVDIRLRELCGLPELPYRNQTCLPESASIIVDLLYYVEDEIFFTILME